MTRSRRTRLSRRALLTRSALVLGSAALPVATPRAHTRVARQPARAGRVAQQADPAPSGVGPLMTALSRYMAAAKDRPLPPEVSEKAKHHILDTIAAIVSGSELPPGQVALALARAQAGRRVATVFGSTVVTGAIDAALVNGVMAHADETDDSHGPSQSHPGASIVPAAFALGEELGVTGERYLRAVTLGYDVGCRHTMALGGITFRNESRRSTHAYAGNFGSAAAAGCIAALSAQQMRWLLDYATQQASGYAIWARDTDHIEKAFVFGGMPARNGVTAALLIQHGWTGVDDVYSGDDNFFQVHAPDGSPSVLVERLGERYEVVETDIKKWSVGTPIQAPLDAIENIRRKRPFEADEVTSVVVRLAPTVGAVVDNRDIPDISLQYMVAVMLVDRTASFHAAHDTARMQDATILRHRRKVAYVPDASLAALLPARVAVVEITLSDGAKLSDRVEAVRGTVRNPMPRSEVVDKARDLIAPVLGAPTAQKLIDAVLTIEAVKDIRTLRPLLRRSG